MLTRIDIKGEIEWTDKRKEKKRCGKIIDLEKTEKTPWNQKQELSQINEL